MRKAEIIAAVIIVVGLILMALNIGIGSAVLIAGMILLMLIYFPMGYAFFNLVRLRDSTKKESFKEVNSKRFYGAIVVGFALAFIIFGAMTKFMLWQDANLILGAGISFLALAFIDAAFYYFRSKMKYYFRIITRMIIIGFAGALIFATPEDTISSFFNVESSVSTTTPADEHSKASGRKDLSEE